ncbi:MAG TPA: DMP19 family protein, partial [Bacteroidales bacterium]
LNGWQHSLLSYHYFREELMQGGFVQLIQNGYGSYIFKNPFAKSLKIIGAEELSKIVYKAKEIYDKHQKDLERETTDEEFHAMYEQYENFADLEERFFEIEEECTSIIAYYVDQHIGDFAEIESRS